MIIPNGARLFFYILVVLCPIWQEFFTKSTDYSLRGLAMPVISSIGAIAAVTLARTKSKADPGSSPNP